MQHPQEASQSTDEWTHTATFAPERQSAARARAFVSSHLIDHRLLHMVDRVRLVASELAADAILHAATPFTVTLSRAGPVVRLEVQDASATAARGSVQVMERDGYGPRIISQLSLDWGTSSAADGSTCVWVCFDALHSREHDGHA
jgi:hypothetical protein